MVENLLIIKIYQNLIIVILLVVGYNEKLKVSVLVYIWL